MEFIITQTLVGLSFGALLFLLASGLSLIFGVMKIVNIAHGSYYMLGAYIGLSVILHTHSFFLGALIGALVIGGVGFLMEHFFLRRLSLMDSQMMLTAGFSLIFRDAALMIWGGNPFGLPAPSFLKGAVHMFSLTFPIYRIFLIGMAALVAIFLWAFNEKTLIGAKLRAAVDDGEMAGGVGINVTLTCGLVFAMGAFLAAFGGVMGGPVFGVYPGADFEFIPYAFVVTIVGGMGSLKGAALGSVLVGLIDTFGKALFPELSYFTLFAPMALILAFRPTGLFGTK